MQTSRCGNAEEIVKWGGGGVVVPGTVTAAGSTHVDVAALARSIETLVGDADARHRLAERGQRAWGERFTWARIAGQYEQLYLEAAGKTA